MLESNSMGQSGENYPPFDLIRTDENQYRIDLAVAGFRPDEIDITAQQNVLIVSGRKKGEDKDESDYIYRGIANRSFERRFALADHIQVRGADLKDGLLSIDLEREIPEAMKPKKIDIGSSAREERSAVGGRRRRPAGVEADGRGRARAPERLTRPRFWAKRNPRRFASGVFLFK